MGVEGEGMELSTVTLAEDLDKDTGQMNLGVSSCKIQEAWFSLTCNLVKVKLTQERADMVLNPKERNLIGEKGEKL